MPPRVEGLDSIRLFGFWWARNGWLLATLVPRCFFFGGSQQLNLQFRLSLLGELLACLEDEVFGCFTGALSVFPSGPGAMAQGEEPRILDTCVSKGMKVTRKFGLFSMGTNSRINLEK